jgi:hypothetical protein
MDIIIVNNDNRGEFTQDWTIPFKGSLVRDIFTTIFNHLAEFGKPKDLVSCMLVCKGWFDLLDPKKDKEIWKTAFKKIATDDIDPNQIDGCLQEAEKFLRNRLFTLEMHVEANLKHLDPTIKKKFNDYQVLKKGLEDRKKPIKGLKVLFQKVFRINQVAQIRADVQSYNLAVNTLCEFQTRFPSIENSPSDNNSYYEYLKINPRLEYFNSLSDKGGLQDFYSPTE